MENPAPSPQRKGTNCHEKASSTIVSKKHNTIDESKIKPFAANGIVRPFSSGNKVENNNSKALTVNHNADSNTLPSVVCMQDVNGHKKIDTDQIPLLYRFASLDLKNSPCNNIDNLITTSYKEYTYDTCKLSTEQEEQIPKKPNKTDYNIFDNKSIFHCIQKPEPEALKEPKVYATLNNTSKYAEAERHPIEKQKSFRFCTPDCKGAHKKIITENNKKKQDTFVITREERDILLKSCENRLKEEDYETTYWLTEIIVACPTTVDFGLTDEEYNFAEIMKTRSEKHLKYKHRNHI